MQITNVNFALGGMNIRTWDPPNPPPPVYMWAWGKNTFGNVGDGTTIDKSSPVQIGALTTWSIINTNEWFSAAIKTDGTLWTWGRNYKGALGLGDETNRSSPVQVGALTTWSRIEGSREGQFLAIKTDGTLWGWGLNTNGRLGLGNTTYYSSPKQIGALTNWVYSSIKLSNAVALKSDGTLWVWGQNYKGALGLGDETNRSSPVQVGALTTWSKVAAGSFQGTAIKTDGTLWTWGRNYGGKLGLGDADTIHRSSPVQVGALTTWTNISGGQTILALG